MKITSVLFALDGTLLPMDNDEFTKGYFKLLAAKLAPHGYDPEQLVAAVWKGTGAMVKNDGSRSNYDAFWQVFAAVLGDKVYDDRPLFDDFYRNEFNNARSICGYSEKSAQIVNGLKDRGFRVALASNPLFPMEAQRARLGWAGVDPDVFGFITAYENYSYCKPNPDYYTAVAGQLGVPAGECLMVGNDVDEDMIAATAAGMSVFLLTDHMINRENKDISAYPRGGFGELEAFLAEL